MYESADDIARFRHKLMDYVMQSGACAVGICNAESLAGGPPSTDLTREMASAKSAIVFAVPLDQDIVEAYMAKVDHGSYQQHGGSNVKPNNIVANRFSAPYWLNGLCYSLW